MVYPKPTFPLSIWDGLTPTTQNPNTEKAPDIDFGNRYRSEIIALENFLSQYIDLFDTISDFGPANTLLGVVGDGTNLEYKEIEGGPGVSISHSEKKIIISVSDAEVLEADAAEQIEIGDAVYIKTDGTLALAKADSSTTKTVAGFAKTDADVGESCQYITEGQIEKADWTDQTGSTNLIPGRIYFLSATAAGKITDVAPNTTGLYIVPVGKALKTTSFDVETNTTILL